MQSGCPYDGKIKKEIPITSREFTCIKKLSEKFTNCFKFDKNNNYYRLIPKENGKCPFYKEGICIISPYEPKPCKEELRKVSKWEYDDPFKAELID